MKIKKDFINYLDLVNINDRQPPSMNSFSTYEKDNFLINSCSGVPHGKFCDLLVAAFYLYFFDENL